MLYFFRESIPDFTTAAIGSIVGLMVFLAAGNLAARLAQAGLRIGDTRKIFHFFVFNSAALVRWNWGHDSIVPFGVVCAAGICWCVIRGNKSGIFRALARPTDFPAERLHVIVPLFCTAVGGVFAHVVCRDASFIPFLIAGWGDAIGEPIGIRWGYHRYRVPSLGAISATRSWEGSLAVLTTSWGAALIGIWLFHRLPGIAPISNYFVLSFVLALVATAMESVTPHGIDNLTILVATAMVLKLWIM